MHLSALDRPEELMDGGQHFDDTPRSQYCEFERRTDLPQDFMIDHLRSMNVTRCPAPRGSTTTNT